MRIESFYQKVLEIRLNARKNNSFVLMFHIVDNAFEKYNEEHISISLNSFKAFVDFLSNKDVLFDRIDNIEKNLINNGRFVYFTFDDIWECSNRNAIVYLEKKGIPYTVFLSENFIGKKNYISFDELLSLSRSELCTLGYHSKSHTFFKKMNDQTEKNELDKTSLEILTQTKIEIFAYPFGSVFACGKNRIKKAKLGNYLFAFSTLSSGINKKTFNEMKFFLPRINVNENNYNNVLKRIIKYV